MRENIFIVDDNEMSLKLLNGILQKEGYTVTTASNGEEALRLIKNAKPELAILDVLMPDMDGYELCRRLRESPDTVHLPIIILTGLSEIDERLKAFDAGADDFIAKPFQAEELLARIKVSLRRSSQQTQLSTDNQAKVIAAFSLRGGIGTSTLMTNLAIGLTQVWSYPVVLVDMALENGISALMLDIPLRYSWGNLAQIQASEIDIDLVSKILLRHESGLRVLAAPRRLQEGELLTADHVKHTLQALRKQCEYLLLDLPHNFKETTLAALDEADQILLLISPELGAVHCANLALQIFDQIGYSREKVKLVMNWVYKGKGLPRAEIEKSLGQKIEAVLPNAGDTLVSALTLGKPPVYTNPSSPLGALFEDLAYSLSKKGHQQNPPKPLPDGYVRVQQRVKSRQK
jgi:pilus assembly protein CpaE